MAFRNRLVRLVEYLEKAGYETKGLDDFSTPDIQLPLTAK
jgi:hypothetical protein